MTTRNMLQVMLATSVALGAAALGSVVYASPGHEDDDGGGPSVEQQALGSGAFGTIEVPRDITVTMTDALRFDPGIIVVSEGETIRFLLDNPTVAPHDFLIGDFREQEQYHQEVVTAGSHAETAETQSEFPAPVVLEPGETAEVLATFGEPGELLVGCHVPGHWEAGMRGTLVVTPADLALGTLEAPRDIAVAMTDALRFDPSTVVVAEGETVRFLLDNPTAAAHDFLLGDLEEQEHHRQEMAEGMGHGDEMDMEMEGGLPPAVTIQPGESAEVIATFDESGELLIGCHVPGHWEAGMRATIAVMPSARLGPSAS